MLIAKSQKATHGYVMRLEKHKAMFVPSNTILFREHFLFL